MRPRDKSLPRRQTQMLAGPIERSVYVGALAVMLGFTALPSAHAHYRKHGSVLLNDTTYTPGASGKMTAKQLCNPSFHTGTVRSVSEKVKKLVCQEYGLKSCKGVEVDHLISLEIGGTNDVSNLWPQPYSPDPGARTKDELENRLHEMVCAGNISLQDAQKAISADWYSEYLKLSMDKKEGPK